MVCTDCPSIRTCDVRKLYSPGYVSASLGKSSSMCKKQGSTCGRLGGHCEEVCALRGNCVDQFKSYWNPSCEIPQIRNYEAQPWFRNRIVQNEWRNFVDQLVTPANIGCRLCPGPDDWQFKCHKARALIGPTVPCVWDLPEQDECASTQYGYNRDWRRYNEDQRMLAGDISCGCNNQPICCDGPKSCEWPPYLGKKFGARYMSWAHPSSLPFPRKRNFQYLSNPKC